MIVRLLDDIQMPPMLNKFAERGSSEFRGLIQRTKNGFIVDNVEHGEKLHYNNDGNIHIESSQPRTYMLIKNHPMTPHQQCHIYDCIYWVGSTYDFYCDGWMIRDNSPIQVYYGKSYVGEFDICSQIGTKIFRSLTHDHPAATAKLLDAEFGKKLTHGHMPIHKHNSTKQILSKYSEVNFAGMYKTFTEYESGNISSYYVFEKYHYVEYFKSSVIHFVRMGLSIKIDLFLGITHIDMAIFNFTVYGVDFPVKINIGERKFALLLDIYRFVDVFPACVYTVQFPYVDWAAIDMFLRVFGRREN